MLVPESIQVENINEAVDVGWQSRENVVSEEHEVLAMEDLRNCPELPVGTPRVNHSSAVVVPAYERVGSVTKFKHFWASHGISAIPIPPPFRLNQTLESFLHVEFGSKEESNAIVLA